MGWTMSTRVEFRKNGHWQKSPISPPGFYYSGVYLGLPNDFDCRITQQLQSLANAGCPSELSPDVEEEIDAMMNHAAAELLRPPIFSWFLVVTILTFDWQAWATKEGFPEESKQKLHQWLVELRKLGPSERTRIIFWWVH
jgi:hypothetical protein